MHWTLLIKINIFLKYLYNSYIKSGVVYAIFSDKRFYVRSFYHEKIIKFLDSFEDQEKQDDYVRSFTIENKENIITGLLNLNANVEEVNSFPEVKGQRTIKYKFKRPEDDTKIDLYAQYNIHLNILIQFINNLNANSTMKQNVGQ